MEGLGDGETAAAARGVGSVVGEPLGVGDTEGVGVGDGVAALAVGLSVEAGLGATDWGAVRATGAVTAGAGWVTGGAADEAPTAEAASSRAPAAIWSALETIRLAAAALLLPWAISRAATPET